MFKTNNYWPKIQRRLLFTFAKYLPDKWYLQKLYPLMSGNSLNLEYPQTFSEKMQWLKLYDRKPLYWRMVDKYEAKQYVSAIIGEKYIIRTLANYENADLIDFRNLPDKFVLKCTHDSGGVIICKSKNLLDIDHIRKKLNYHLKRNFYWKYREWPYKNVKPQIIAEEYLENEGADLKDYKFWCFNGEPLYCQVISDRHNKMAIDFYDMNWTHQVFHEPKSYAFSEENICRPLHFREMQEAAKMISKGHPFLRVDFYEANRQMYFGEMTFFPTSGWGGFDPVEWDEKFGELIKLPI